MKAFLLYRDRDFDRKQKLPWHEQALIQDLELSVLFNAMALGDEFLLEVARKVALSSLSNVDNILYRQDILKDCLENSSLIREIYALALEAIQREKQGYWSIFSKYPQAILSRSLEVLEMFVSMLKKLRNIADIHADKFRSEGFITFFAMLQRELTDDYFAIIQGHLRELRFRDGVLMSAQLGKGNKGINFVLRKWGKKPGWLERILGDGATTYTFHIADRDESGSRALTELKDRGIDQVANALAQSADHILSFFHMLRTELAFYIGCLNLHEQLIQMNEPVSFPVPVAPGQYRHSFKGLYDVSLALTVKKTVVGNDVNADNKHLFIVTGANQGGKSTFLRSVGLSQLMMQCGMFVAAEEFSANVCNGLFTHYKREEDVTLQSGKLDEELGRMSEIVDHITPNSMLLFNESFAATNEREGSEIARQIVQALLDRGLKIFFVTHMYEFAHGFYRQGKEDAIFLRAERQDDGLRTFKLIEGEPLQTSYGEDLYYRIFATQ